MPAHTPTLPLCMYSWLWLCTLPAFSQPSQVVQLLYIQEEEGQWFGQTGPLCLDLLCPCPSLTFPFVTDSRGTGLRSLILLTLLDGVPCLVVPSDLLRLLCKKWTWFNYAVLVHKQQCLPQHSMSHSVEKRGRVLFCALLLPTYHTMLKFHHTAFPLFP